MMILRKTCSGTVATKKKDWWWYCNCDLGTPIIKKVVTIWANHHLCPTSDRPFNWPNIQSSMWKAIVWCVKRASQALPRTGGWWGNLTSTTKPKLITLESRSIYIDARPVSTQKKKARRCCWVCAAVGHECRWHNHHAPHTHTRAYNKINAIYYIQSKGAFYL